MSEAVSADCGINILRRVLEKMMFMLLSPSMNMRDMSYPPICASRTNGADPGLGIAGG